MASIIEKSCFINSFCQPFATSGNFFTFQQDNAPAHRVRETVQLLICEIPDYTAPALWPANNPELNPIDYQTWKQLTS